MTEFQKIRRFTGTKKHAETHVFLQCRDNQGTVEVGELATYTSPSSWVDVLDITKLGPFIEEIPWESEQDETSFKQAQEAEYRKALR